MLGAPPCPRKDIPMASDTSLCTFLRNDQTPCNILSCLCHPDFVERFFGMRLCAFGEVVHAFPPL